MNFPSTLSISLPLFALFALFALSAHADEKRIYQTDSLGNIPRFNSDESGLACKWPFHYRLRLLNREKNLQYCA